MSSYVNQIRTQIIKATMEVSLWLLLYIMSFLRYITTGHEQYGEGIRTDGGVQKVLVNGSAQIKCDVSSNIPNDQVLLVVWYKNNLPIYSYDTRGAHAGTPSHWREEEVLEDRAIFRTIREPAELIISPVLEKDVGNFRCRVDFKLTPTRNSNINLEVVVPPHPPKIVNDRGEHIQSRAGPYEEGGDLHLVCEVTGGSPPPTITWSSNGQILSSTMADYSPLSTLQSKLTVRNLSRIHQHALYTCQASNFHKKGVSTNITIELFLRPLSVEIVFSNQPLSADRGYDIECMAVGSRPASKITWWMGGIELSGHSQTVSADGNISTSTLHFTPTRQDNGKTLVCRATNELVKRGMKEASMKLNVCFVPTLLLDLGSNLNPEDIEEGDDVYFECKVHANPAAYKVIWKHNVVKMNLIRKIPSKFIRTSHSKTTSVPKDRWTFNPFVKKYDPQSHIDRGLNAGLYVPLEEYPRYRKEVLNLSTDAESNTNYGRKRARDSSDDDHFCAKRRGDEDRIYVPQPSSSSIRRKRIRDSYAGDSFYHSAKKPRLNDPSVQYAVKQPSQYADPNRKILENLFEITADGWKKKSNGFEYHTQIRGTTYYEVGSSIDDAREHVAETVLKELCNIKRENIRWPEHLLPFRLNQEFADTIERLVKTKFDDIMERDHRRYKVHKVLAGIVMTHEMSLENAKVVAIGTGTKCKASKNDDEGGKILHDMHAEVLARRSFVRFLCSQLKDMLKKKTSIFQWNGKDIRLKEGVKFHLYCNAIPCGDARVFSLKGLIMVKNEAKMGTLRLKKIGGTNPISENSFRITSMSCSDKIARWNVLGLQGSQLAKFIAPIYLASMVLGSAYSPAHLYRAISGRLTNTLNDLPNNYRLNQPLFESTTLIETENYPTSESMNFGVCWSDVSDGENGPEVLDLLTGLTNRGETSNVSKLSFLRMHKRMNEMLPIRSDDEIAIFRKVEEKFYFALKKQNFGAWDIAA